MKLFKTNRVISLLFFILFCQVSFGQISLGFDYEFGQGGIVNTSIPGYDSDISSIFQLADNKIVIVGEAYDDNSNEVMAVVARYLVDGTLDTSFGTNGITSFYYNNLSITLEELAVDAAGKIYVVGYIESTQGLYTAVISRLTADGFIDTTFGNAGFILTSYGTALESAGLDIAIQPDGKIIIAGVVEDNSNPNYDELADFALARYNTDGTLDTSFGNSGYVITEFNANHYDYIASMQLQADGKIVAGGLSTTEDPNTFEETSDVVAARYNSDGSLDASFGNSGKVIINIGDFDYIDDMALQNDGKILLSGDTYIESQGIDDSMVMRLNTDGSLDSSFSGSGYVITPFLNSSDSFSSAFSVFPNSDGSILAAGYAYDGIGDLSYVTFAKYHADGSLDTAFRDDGKFEYQDDQVDVYDAIVTNAGKLLFGGSILEWNPDPTYNLLLAQFVLTDRLGTEDFTADNVSVYPNPVKNTLNVHFKTATINTEIALFDTTGRLVAKLITNTTNETLDLSNLSNGIYYLKISQDGKTFTEKIIKN